MSTLQTIQFFPFKKRVENLKRKKRALKKRQETLNKAIKNTDACLDFLGGILRTHQAKETPKHTSGESMFFFKDKSGECCLIEELSPSPLLMPDMKRISIKHALTKDMQKNNGRGYVIQQVTFCAEKGGHKLMLVCFDRFIIESL